MYPRSVQKLIELFTKLPGIGPRQATRLTFFILRNGEELGRDLSAAITEIRQNVSFCQQCFRSVEKGKSGLCYFCSDSRRDSELLAVVERESDILNLERTKNFNGLYHVLNGFISPLEPESPQKLHLKDLYKRAETMLTRHQVLEIILATSPTTEGEATAMYIERIFETLCKKYPDLKISRLGRGLSLGSELEYSDEETLRNALKNRR